MEVLVILAKFAAWIAAVIFFALAIVCSALTYIAYNRFPSDMIYGPIWSAAFWIAFALSVVVAKRLSKSN